MKSDIEAPADDLELPEEPFDFAAYNRLGHPMFNHAVKRSDYDTLLSLAWKLKERLEERNVALLAHDEWERICSELNTRAVEAEQRAGKDREDAERWRQIYKDAGDACYELQRKVDAARKEVKL